VKSSPDSDISTACLPAHGGCAPWMTGTLVYHAAFWRHDAVGLRDPPNALPGA
jgi:putative acetyltransferase